MVTELILVRHGEIDANVQGLWYGTTDAELNARGRAQVAALKEKIHSKYSNISKVYCSPLKRTLNTAIGVAAALQQPPEPCPELIEYGIGELEGTSFDDLHRVHDFFSKMSTDQNYASPGGESINGVSERIQSGVRRLVANHPGERIALVGHGAAFGILLAGYLTGSPFPFNDHHLSNTGIAHLKMTDNIELLRFDDIDHLAGL